jgi:hypothetical protein
MKTELRIKSVGQYGKTMGLPIIGEVVISDKGIITTDNAEVIDMLLNRTSDWELANPPVVKSEDDSETKGQFADLSLVELIDMAIEMEYPEKEYSKYKKNQKLMVTYLNKKSKED